MSTKKRKIDEVNNIDKPGSSTDLHFAVASVSPLKTAWSGVPYIHASVTDGTTKAMRLVGFDGKQQSDIAALTATRSPVKAENCQIKLSRDDSTTFEIMFGSKTKVLPSPRMI